eukprot:6192760-Pleurochrysis_carterae.AAC.2
METGENRQCGGRKARRRKIVQPSDIEVTLLVSTCRGKSGLKPGRRLCRPTGLVELLNFRQFYLQRARVSGALDGAVSASRRVCARRVLRVGGCLCAKSGREAAALRQRVVGGDGGAGAREGGHDEQADHATAKDGDRVRQTRMRVLRSANRRRDLVEGL